MNDSGLESRDSMLANTSFFARLFSKKKFGDLFIQGFFLRSHARYIPSRMSWHMSLFCVTLSETLCLSRLLSFFHSGFFVGHALWGHVTVSVNVTCWFFALRLWSTIILSFFKILSECSAGRTLVRRVLISINVACWFFRTLLTHLWSILSSYLFFKNLTEYSYFTQRHEDAWPFTTTLAVHVICSFLMLCSFLFFQKQLLL